MKTCINLLGLGILFLTSFTALAQKDAVVFVTNAEATKATVSVKWLLPNIYSGEGIDVLRKVQGTSNWIKLNQTPIVMQDAETYFTKEELENDKVLSAGVGMTDGKKPEELEGIEKFALLTFTFQNSRLSTFLGMQFDDQTAISGTTYQYEVRRTRGDKILGASKMITAGPFEKADPLTDLALTAEETIIKVNWTHDEERFWAADIFRKEKGSSLEIKINPTPLFIQRVPDPNTGEEKYPNPLFTDTMSIEVGKTYIYRVAGYDYFGDLSEFTDPVEVLVEDLTPPTQPSNINLKQNAQEVIATWELDFVDSDLAGFHVYRSREAKEGYEKVTTELISENVRKYIDKVTGFGGFYYSIVAVDEAGNERFSFPAFIEVKDVIPPAMPQSFELAADTGKFILSWELNTEEDFAGYKVYRQLNTNKPNDFLPITPELIKTNRYEHPMPKNVRNQFYFKVIAVDTAGNRSPQTKALVARMPDVIPPSAPFLTKAIEEDEAVELTWMPSNIPDLAIYKVYRQQMDDEEKSEPVLIDEVEKAETVFRDETVQAGVRYEYSMTSVDSTGNESEFSNATTILLKQNTEAATPSNVQLQFLEEEKSVSVRFEVESKLTTKGYTVLRSENGRSFSPISGLTQETTILDKDVKEGKTYYYQVRVYDESGKIARSTPVSIDL
ncbi:MAG: hypothetical protein AAF740_00135 [Bacteroidota bacterium]